ncbi:DegT/DnrJ/EryC1/StrS family aminotransferase [Syntrophorhabdus aromaticivorans]|uniref:DegT/DnrJ/EryC1/StrS family aminotransferase n=1 Tax=Syntrophorhabdus aromaticivorans TaxID=328301 RepID=A0A971RZD4_9BACT|nr:DegT/DnrJ/EryC1/StrS family aminotransferase [Syntrophorhabdus aromaticivorans]NLW34188.1 DegT/DnrJ/EryC1/StrS family aminotransferase [Syntrophorhabdus aromaticivorans]
MNIPPINLKSQFRQVRNDVFHHLKEILKEQKLILGEYCSRLEEAIGGYVGVPCAVSCANGTDALILSLMALGIRPGDEVITTPYTFFSTASSVALVGAKPVFVDIEPGDMNINPDLIEKSITPKTKAIIVVHLFGKVCDMEQILDTGRKHGIPVVEDMAQSLGAMRYGKMSGTFGDIAAVSFYPTKNLGGIGEGGMVLSKRKDLGEKARKLRVHGMGSIPYHHEIIGINSRLDEIKACALVVKFPYLQTWNKKRLENAKYYNIKLKNLPITLPRIDSEQSSHIFHQYVIRTEERDKLQAFLKESGIQTGVYYPVPLHLQECFSYLGYKKGDFPVSEKAALTSLALPVFPELKKTEKDYVVACVKEFFEDIK